jgi:hypothetical protein
VQAGGRLVIAIDGKAVRGAKGKNGKAPHLVAALAHGTGAVTGQVAAQDKSNEVPAVRELLKAFADLAGAVLTTGAMHTQHDTAQVIPDRGADWRRPGPGSTVPPRSRICAAWPSAPRAWTDTPTSPPPTAITPETRSRR